MTPQEREELIRLRILANSIRELFIRMDLAPWDDHIEGVRDVIIKLQELKKLQER